MGKEIEVRHVLKNKVELMKWLNGNAVPCKKSHQIDTYYDNKYHSFVTDTEHIYKWLRIREEDGKMTINYKHWLPEGQVKRTYCDEYESIIQSPEDVKKILEHLGFEVFIVVDKTRHTWKLDDVEIAIDTVSELGDYIEVEYKEKDYTDIRGITDRLHIIIQKMGAEVGEEDHGGYGFKLIQKRKKG